MSKGDKRQKIEAAFRFYDKDNSGSLDCIELTDYMSGVLKLQWAGNPEFKTLKEIDVERVASATVKKAF